jgi:hypothetical protein
MDNTEIDILEAMSGDTAYNGGMHHWHPDGSDTNTGGLTGGSFAVPPGTDFSQPHRYGVLSVPASGNTQGYVQWYFDGKPVGPKVTCGLSGVYSTLAHEPIKLMVGTGTVNPMTVYDVSVWQKDTSKNQGIAPLPVNALTQCRPASFQSTDANIAIATAVAMSTPDPTPPAEEPTTTLYSNPHTDARVAAALSLSGSSAADTQETREPRRWKRHDGHHHAQRAQVQAVTPGASMPSAKDIAEIEAIQNQITTLMAQVQALQAALNAKIAALGGS